MDSARRFANQLALGRGTGSFEPKIVLLPLSVLLEAIYVTTLLDCMIPNYTLGTWSAVVMEYPTPGPELGLELVAKA